MVPSEIAIPDAPACPLLGLAADSRTHFTFPHPAHRCHADRSPGTLDQARQAIQCLTPDYPACDRFQAHELGRRAAPPITTPRRPASVAPTATPRPAPALTARTPATDPAPRPTQGTPPAPVAAIVHVFRAGDSLARIAAAYGLTLDELIAANGLSSADSAVDGQRLAIPLWRPPGGAPGS